MYYVRDILNYIKQALRRDKMRNNGMYARRRRRMAGLFITTLLALLMLFAIGAGIFWWMNRFGPAAPT